MAKKDSFWFKHDSISGRGLRMLKMAHIYGHWGKGVYWDVIEVLRSQANYKFESDESSLQMLCDLIGCKDHSKFISWFKDCVRISLFILEENVFFSEVLCENMENWETKKINGSKGGRPQITETITESKANCKPNRKRNVTIREEKRREEEKEEAIFNSFRSFYPGTKLGNQTEFDNFCKKHKDWKEVLPNLISCIEKQIKYKEYKAKKGEFVPEWKNLKTWINNRCWEEEIPVFEEKKQIKSIPASTIFETNA